MPSFEHGVLVQIFRDSPDLVPAVLASALHVPVPTHRSAAVVESVLDALATTDYRADLVVELRDAAGEPALAVIVEVQLARDPAKKLSWPLYVALVRARRRCRTCLLVVSPDAAVARWAAEAIDLGPGGTLRPLVLGPAEIPRIVDPGLAAAQPGLAVLSARVHASDEGGAEILAAIVRTLSHLDRATATVYFSYLYQALGGPTQSALEEMLMALDLTAIDPNWRFEDTELGKRLSERYLEKWRQETRAEGLAEGRAAGRAEAKREILLRLLGRLGLSLSDAERARVEACSDVSELDGWIDRAVTAKTCGDVFS